MSESGQRPDGFEAQDAEFFEAEPGAESSQESGLESADDADLAPLTSDPMGIRRRAHLRARGRVRQLGWVLVLYLVLSGVLVFMLRGELGYFFASRVPVDLGAAEEFPNRPLPDQAFVRLSGVARDMCIRADVLGGRMRYLYLLGSEMGARILVQAPAVPGESCQGAEDRVFEGRLRDLASTGMFSAVLGYYREHFPASPRDGPMYLLEDGVRPGQAWAYPAAVLALGVVAALNAWFLIRRRRRALVAPGAEGEA